MRPTLIISIMLAVASLFISCDDDDNPVKQLQPKDYSFYAWCLCDDDIYYRFHSASSRIDTLPFPNYYAWYGVKVSSDGKLLFIATSQAVKVLSLLDNSEIASIPQKAYEELQVSENGGYIAIAGESLVVYSTVDYSPVYSKPGEIYAVSFVGGSNILYYSDRTVMPNIVRRVDLSTGAETDYEWPDGGISGIRVSRDESRWYLYSQLRSTTGRFDVFDVAKDSVIFREWLYPGSGTLQLSPDEKWVCYSYPGAPSGGYIGPSQFTLFDAAQNRIKMIVNTAAIKDGWNPVSMPIGELVFSPDSRVVLAASPQGVGAFVMFDIERLEVTRYTEMATRLGSFSSQQQR